MTPLERLAALAAVEAPERRNASSVSACVSWETIAEIRTELERLGFDWRVAVKERKRLELEQRRSNYERRQRL